MHITMTSIPGSEVFKHIKAQGTAKPIVDAMKRQLRSEGLNIAKEYHKTTATWNHKPKFEVKVKETTDGMEVVVSTDDKIYYFLDKGTKVRYAHMTRDWISKTYPEWIGSIEGRGLLAYIDTSNPMPGIEARNFSKLIYEYRQPVYESNANRLFTSLLVAYLGSVGIGKQ